MNTIYENSVLMSAAEKMSNPELGILNLVRPDWRKVLENNPTFQAIRKNAADAYYEPQVGKTVQNGQNKGTKQYVSVPHVMNVLVLGKWTLFVDPEKGYEVIIESECEPLVEIVKTMVSDVDKDKTKITDTSFFVESCNPIYCRWCRKTRENLKMSLHTDKKEWCILKTRVFDGENIKNAFKASIVNNFRGQPFYGILCLQLNSRYFYNKNNEDYCKVSGICKNMLLFKETCLVVNPDLDLDYVESLDHPSSSCSHNPEITVGHEPLDFLDSVPLAITKRFNDEPPNTKSNKKMKHDDADEPVACIPERIDRVSYEKETENDFNVITDKFTM